MWRIPLDELRDRDWRRGCSARVRLATGREFEHPRGRIFKKYYAKLLRNAQAALPEKSG